MKTQFKRWRRSATSLALCSFLALGVSWGAQEKKEEKPPFAVKVSTDRADALYHKGEKAKFLVSVLDEMDKPVVGKTVNVFIAKEAEKIQKVMVVTREEPVEVEGGMDKPGFILCTASFEYEPGKKISGMGGAGFDPLEIKAPPAPDDFMQFWDAQKAELAKVPMNPVLTPVEAQGSLKGKVEAFDVRLDCVGGVQVSGYYARPVSAAAKSCPALLNVHGAGVRSANRMDGRAAQGVIAMDINAHGIENGKPAEFYDELSKGRLNGYPKFDANNRDKCYFKGMFLRVLRALAFLKAQPEWDGKTLVISGGSQGGAQAFVGAALDPQVTYCNAIVPAMCNHSAYVNGCNAGWPRFVALDAAGKPTDEQVAKSVPYFDMVNFTPHIKAETFVGVGFIDTTCAPSSVYAAYNNLRCVKGIENSPPSTHSFLGKQPAERLEAYLKKAKGAK